MTTQLRALIFFGFCACASPTPEAGSPPEGADPATTPGKADGLFSDDVPFADLYNATASITLLPVRGRLIDEDEDDIGALDLTPLSQISQDEIKWATVSLWLISDKGEAHDLGDLRTDEEGYLDALFDIRHLHMSPGQHTVEVWFKGAWAGAARVTLLDEGRVAPVVRSDVDLTYLFTDFHGLVAQLKLMDEAAAEKRALPGMPEVYQGLNGAPITFLSGSPRFFKRTLEARMALDRINQFGLVLKPFKDIVYQDFIGFDWDQIAADLKEQIGYKLYWLLRLRQQLPDETPEILMGDDSEADFVAYNLYARLLWGELSPALLREALESLGVSQVWLGAVVELASALRSPAPPLAIYINLTATPGEAYDIEDWTLSGLTRAHHGAWPLALDLFEEGLLDAAAVHTVKAALISAGSDEEALKAAASAARYLEPETAAAF